MTATRHSSLAKQNQPPASTGSGVNTKQQLEEYMEMTGKEQDSNKIQEDGSMYVDLETVQDYEVPVNRRKPSSSDLTYL